MNPNLYIIRLSSLGDVAMTIQAVKIFQNQFPKAQVFFISRRNYQPIIEHYLNVQFIPIDREDGRLNFLDLIQFAREISFKKPAIWLDLHNVLRTKVLSNWFRFGGVDTYQIQKHRSDKKYLIQQKPKELYNLPHRVEDVLSVFRDSGFLVKPQEQLIKPKQNSSGNYKIGIAPFSKHPSKEYDLTLITEVIDALSKLHSMEFFIFGNGRLEAEKAVIFDSINSVTNCVNNLSFEKENALIKNLDLMISMDSANGHLASLESIPVLTLWGVTHPCLGYYPYGQNPDWSLFPDSEMYPNLPISIYGHLKSDEYIQAINSISPKQIVQKVKDILHI